MTQIIVSITLFLSVCAGMLSISQVMFIEDDILRRKWIKMSIGWGVWIVIVACFLLWTVFRTI